MEKCYRSLNNYNFKHLFSVIRLRIWSKIIIWVSFLKSFFFGQIEFLISYIYWTRPFSVFYGSDDLSDSKLEVLISILHVTLTSEKLCPFAFLVISSICVRMIKNFANHHPDSPDSGLQK